MRLESGKKEKMGVLLSTTAIIRIWPLWILHLISCRAVRKIKVKTHIDSSDMLETGQSSKLLYRQVAELVHSRGVEKIIGVGERDSYSLLPGLS